MLITFRKRMPYRSRTQANPYDCWQGVAGSKPNATNNDAARGKPQTSQVGPRVLPSNGIMLQVAIATKFTIGRRRGLVRMR